MSDKDKINLLIKAIDEAKANGEETIDIPWDDIDICSSCGEHSEETIDVETGDSLGSNCCGASAVYID